MVENSKNVNFVINIVRGDNSDSWSNKCIVLFWWQISFCSVECSVCAISCIDIIIYVILCRRDSNHAHCCFISSIVLIFPYFHIQFEIHKSENAQSRYSYEITRKNCWFNFCVHIHGTLNHGRCSYDKRGSEKPSTVFSLPIALHASESPHFIIIAIAINYHSNTRWKILPPSQTVIDQFKFRFLRRLYCADLRVAFAFT